MNWEHIQRFYEELSLTDIYEQPDEEGRIEISRNLIAFAPIGNIDTVLDVGCGYGYAQELFYGKIYFGITRSVEEVQGATEMGRRVWWMDYNFIEFPGEFDLIFSSHALEHSPFPVLTLMEWHRVGKNLLLIVPNPKHYGYIGKNHYSVSEPSQIRWWLRRAGWKVYWKNVTDTDIAYLCSREPRIGAEGWAKFNHEVYKADRDDKLIDEDEEE